MTRLGCLLIIGLSAISSFIGCQSTAPSRDVAPFASHNKISIQSPGQRVTIIIALSSIVPGGIVGHAGIAVGDQYWDYGPKRRKILQPLKSIRSKAGPWWDDPDQQWITDRNLEEVLTDMPDKIHPLGSLVAVFEVQVTDVQAQAITRFWQNTYERMRNGKDIYRLTAKQCASMVAWSLHVGLQDEASTHLPSDLRGTTPTRLYETLCDNLIHTAGPNHGQHAQPTLWQLDQNGLSLWRRPHGHDRCALTKRPRLRLAFERLKHWPADLLH